MSSLDFLYYALGGGFLVLVGFLSYVLVHVVETLRSVKRMLDNVEDITNDVREVKNSMKSGAFHLGKLFLTNFASKRR